MNKEQYLAKAKEMRREASEIEGWDMLTMLAEATRYETFADMMNDPKHPMWRCIELEKARNAAKQTPSTQKTRPPFRWDTTMGYKGRDCKTQIHSGTQRYARLTFK